MRDGIQPPADKDAVNELRHKLFDHRNLHVPIEFLQKVELQPYLWAAVFQAAVIHQSQEMDWKTPAWDFGRFAKTHPDLFDMDSGSALQRVKETIGAGFWSEHLGMEPVDAEMAFDAIWNSCKSIPGRDHLTAAISKAKVEVLGSAPDSPAGYELFVAIARWLQELATDNSFQLPVHTLAARLECLPMTISRYRQKAIRDGLLRIVKPHSYRSGGSNRATEFRFAPRGEGTGAENS